MAKNTVMSKINLGKPIDVSGEATAERLAHLVRYTVSCTQAFLDEHCTIEGLLNLEAKLGELKHQNAVLADEEIAGYRMRTPCANSRVLKMAQDRGLSIMRGYLWRFRAFPTLVESVYSIEAMPTIKRQFREWRASVESFVKSELKVTSAECSALVRPIINYRRNHPEEPMPEFFDVFNKPDLKIELANLGAADHIAFRREVIVATGAMTYRLEAKLPTTATPECVADFPWTTLDFPIPECYRNRIVALDDPSKQLSLPMFTVEQDGSVAAEIVIKEPRPENPGYRNVYIGLDYGLTTPYTAAAVYWDWETDTGDAERTYELSTSDTLAPKIMRLKDESSLLQGKIKRLELLAESSATAGALEAKIERLQTEKDRVDRKAQNLRNANSHIVASWVSQIVDLEEAATVVVEDLSTLEPQLSRKLNKVMTESTRSATEFQIKHRMDRKGVDTETVFARGTSQTCPSCLNRDGTHAEDYKLMTCPECGLRTGRDKAAGQMIAMRGAQKQARREKIKTAAEDRPVVARDKKGPTPKRLGRIKRTSGKLKCLRASKPRPSKSRKHHASISAVSSNAQESAGTTTQRNCAKRKGPVVAELQNDMPKTPRLRGSQMQSTG
jgi:transposase